MIWVHIRELVMFRYIAWKSQENVFAQHPEFYFAHFVEEIDYALIQQFPSAKQGEEITNMGPFY